MRQFVHLKLQRLTVQREVAITQRYVDAGRARVARFLIRD
jgi:hypothetical protein